MSDRESFLPAADEQAADAPLAGPVGISRRERSSRRESSPYSHKFMVATAALVGLAIGAVAVAVAVLLSGSSSTATVEWSQWSPPDKGIAGEREIADEVSPLYRATPATQLVVVTARNVSDTSNGTQLAVRDPNNGSLSAVSGTSAIYTLCGLGPNCAISTGRASSARLLLLRREALELALYTFRYIGGIQNVVTILPPGHTEQPGQLTKKPPSSGKVATTSTLNIAVVFQRAGLSPFLSAPLRATLPEPVPPTVEEMSSAPEAERVSVITGQGLFSQQLVQTQDGSSVLVLNPLPPQ
jgi:hypothetical protein